MWIIPSSSMDIHQSMDIPSPIDIITQTLLGLREGSDLMSERHASDLEKGENESERTAHFFRGCKRRA